MKAAILAASLMPLADSTPLDTSTADGRTCRTASPTFSTVKPPDRMTGSGKPLRHAAPVEGHRRCRRADPRRMRRAAALWHRDNPARIVANPPPASCAPPSCTAARTGGRMPAFRSRGTAGAAPAPARAHGADFVRRRVHEQAHRRDERRQRAQDRASRGGRDVARARRGRTRSRSHARPRVCDASASSSRVMPQIFTAVAMLSGSWPVRCRQPRFPRVSRVGASGSPQCASYSTRGKIQSGRLEGGRGAARGRGSASTRADPFRGCAPLPT